MSETKRQWAWFWATLKEVDIDEPTAKELTQIDSFNQWLDENPVKTQADLMNRVLLEYAKALHDSLDLPEASASANMKARSPKGFVWQFTMRNHLMGRLVARAAILEATLLKKGWEPNNGSHVRTPTQQTTHPDHFADEPQGTPQYTDDNPPSCPYHGPMKRSKHYDGFFCPAKMGDGSYCKEKWPQ